MNQELITSLTTNLHQLNHTLPTNSKVSEAIQVINYAIIASVIAGMAIYHYIKEQEQHA